MTQTTMLTMMMTINDKTKTFGISVVLCIFLTLSAYSESDFETWHAFEIEAKVMPKTNIWLSNEVRMFDNSSFYKKYLLDIGFDYKLTKQLTCSGAYRFSHFIDNNFYKIEQMGYGLIKYSYRIQRFIFQLQTRWQYSTEVYHNAITKEAWYARNKITINYKWSKTYFTPYLAFEHFTQIYPNIYAEKFRIFSGIKYSFNKFHTVSLYYAFQQWFDKNKNIYLVGWKYAYTINTLPKKGKYKNED